MAFITKGKSARSFHAAPARSGNHGTIRSKLLGAMEASNKAGEAFGRASQQMGSAPLGQIKDCFHEASEDDKDKDCSRYGTTAAGHLKTLSQTKFGASQLGRTAERAQAQCTKQLEEARRLIGHAGLSPELSQHLDQALKLGNNSRGSAQVVQRELGKLSSPLTTMETSAWSVSLDESPTGIMNGRDVSTAAEDGERSADACARPLQTAARSAAQGTSNQAQISQMIQGALTLIDQQAAAKGSPTRESASPVRTSPRASAPSPKALASRTNSVAVFQELEAIMEAPGPVPEEAAPRPQSGFVSLKPKRPSAIGGESLVKVVAGRGEVNSRAPTVLTFDFQA